ncbi:hypothetical protein KC906_01435 [Candidatus Kaiserbacteria bacterium]|nr:hypothetical protein [Candidatus Kaiserbacteria bacterium]
MHEDPLQALKRLQAKVEADPKDFRSIELEGFSGTVEFFSDPEKPPLLTLTDHEGYTSFIVRTTTGTLHVLEVRDEKQRISTERRITTRHTTAAAALAESGQLEPYPTKQQNLL